MIAATSAAASPPREAFWVAFALAAALLLTPNCCLTGSHAHGADMAAFGPICRALR